MATRVDVRFRLYGPHHAAIRKAIQSYLLARGLKRSKRLKLLNNHYEGLKLSDFEAIEVAYHVYLIASTFDDNTGVAELVINSFPNVSLVISKLSDS